jgi:hypothetical protein
MREQVLPFLRKWVHPMDDDGAPLSDNFLLSKVLRYGVRDARKMNRISSTLSFHEMLPNYVVDAITALARGEQPLRRLRRNARCGSRPCQIGSRSIRRDSGAGTAVRPIRWDRSAANLPGQLRGQSAGTAAANPPG